MKHAVVTGGAQGIGAAVARRLAADGMRLTLMGRRLDALRALADEIGRGAAAVAVDVRDEARVERAFVEARAAHGPIAVLVNNAGQAETAPLRKTDLALWQRMLDVNLTGGFLCTRQALPDMLEARHGRIVNIASTAGQRGYAYATAYVAAKHGVIGLTRALALEVARQGVTVNAVCPGYTDTDLLRSGIEKIVASTGRSPAEARAVFERANPQGRVMQPGEVAAAVAWLCSDGAAAVTGQCIGVSGGEVMA